MSEKIKFDWSKLSLAGHGLYATASKNVKGGGGGMETLTTITALAQIVAGVDILSMGDDEIFALVKAFNEEIHITLRVTVDIIDEIQNQGIALPDDDMVIGVLLEIGRIAQIQPDLSEKKLLKLGVKKFMKGKVLQ